MLEAGARFLDRFTIERLLGEGGFAEVWLAHGDDGERYAIKAQRRDVRADAAARAFAREAGRARAVLHPGVVRIFEAGVVDGRGYLVMEHVDGVTLEEELSRLRAEALGLSVDTARSWARQLAQAVDALHAASLVHRDLKPSNIMIHGPRRQVKVLDLGLVHDAEVEAEDLTTLGRVKGTTAYMSPEQALGERVGAASDVFALTTIVFELLTGLRPWLVNEAGGMVQVGVRVPAAPNDRLEVLRRLTSGRRPLPSVLVARLPPGLDRVFAAGWAVEPSDRPLTASAWAAQLDTAFAGVSADTSAWPSLGGNEPQSLARARAPRLGAVLDARVAEVRSMTPVAATRLIQPVAETQRMWPPSEAQRPAGSATFVPDGWVESPTVVPEEWAESPTVAPDEWIESPTVAPPDGVELPTVAPGSSPSGRVDTGADVRARSGVGPATWVAAAAMVLVMVVLAIRLVRGGSAPTVEVEPPSPTDPAPAMVAAGPPAEVTSSTKAPVVLEPSGPPTSPSGSIAGAVGVAPAETAAPLSRTKAPPPRTKAPAPRASVSPTPRPSEPVQAPPATPPPSEGAATLRARLDRGAPLEDIARAVRAQAAPLDARTRLAIDRWAATALELGDPRPLHLAIDALEAATPR